MRWAPAVLGGTGSALLLAMACREPTEMVVQVTTDFDCAQLSKNEVSFYGGPAVDPTRPVSSTSRACADKRVGSVVVTRSGGGDHVVIEVIAALAPLALDANGRCDEKVAGCIHARRDVAFLSHTPLKIPITLEASCSGHPCDPNETCRAGTCVSSAIDSRTCDPTSCNLPNPTPPTNPLAAECGTGGTQAGAPFPGSAGCMARTGSSTEVGPSKTTTRDDPITLVGQPTNAVIDRDNVAYVATDTGDLYSIVLEPTPSIRWHVTFATTPSNAAGSLLLSDDGRLYVAGDTGLRGYALGDGSEPRAAVDLGAQINSDLGAGSGLITATVTTGHIHSASTSTFTPGPTSGNGAYQTGPTYFAGRVWVGNNGGELYQVDPATLAESGGPYVPNGDRVTGIAGAPDGRLRLVLDDGSANFTIAAFDPGTLKNAWAKPIGPHPAVRFLVAHDGSTWVSDDVLLSRIDANGNASGTAIATTTLYPGLDLDGNVYVIESPASTLASYGPNTALRWRAAATSELREVVVAKRGILVGLGTDGKVHVFR